MVVVIMLALDVGVSEKGHSRQDSLNRGGVLALTVDARAGPINRV